LIVQVPTLRTVTLPEVTVQTSVVVEIYVTARPEEAVAVRLTVGNPRLNAGGAKEIVCVPLVTLKVR
jgi:hypothetical protein